MDVTVAKKDLLPLAARASAIAEKKGTLPVLPVLANVALASGVATGALTLRATDLYLSVASSLPAEVRDPGSIAVPARDLLERIKAMPDGPVHLSTDAAGHQLTLKAAGAARRYTLHGLPGTEFPQLPQPKDDAPRIVFPAPALAALLACTTFSVSPDDTRPALNSVLFEWANDLARMVSTDGHRLTKMSLVVDGERGSASTLLPLKAALELRRLADAQGEGTVTVIAGDPNLFFQVEATLLGVKLAGGIFPSYGQVIPKSHTGRAVVPRAALADALRAVSLASSDRVGGVALSFAPGLLTVRGQSAERGDGSDEVPAEYAGKALQIGVHAKYMLDALGPLDGEEDVALSFSGELDPVVLEKANGTSNYLAVIMPLRL